MILYTEVEIHLQQAVNGRLCTFFGRVWTKIDKIEQRWTLSIDVHGRLRLTDRLLASIFVHFFV